jgi:hypothetical protein
MISFTNVSNLRRPLEEGWDTPQSKSGDQSEIKSPPGPNLHKGSICLFARLSIFLPVLLVDNHPTAATQYQQQLFLSVIGRQKP